MWVVCDLSVITLLNLKTVSANITNIDKLSHAPAQAQWDRVKPYCAYDPHHPPRPDPPEKVPLLES